MLWKAALLSTSIFGKELVFVPKPSTVFCFASRTDWSAVVSQKSTSFLISGGITTVVSPGFALPELFFAHCEKRKAREERNMSKAEYVFIMIFYFHHSLTGR